MVNEVRVVCANESQMFSHAEIKRSSSEPDFDIEEFLSKAIVVPEENDSFKANNVVGGAAYEFFGPMDERFLESDVVFCDDCSAAPLKNWERKTVPLKRGRLSEALWSQNLTPKHPSISGTIDSQSSECVGLPASADQPTGESNQVAKANDRSSHEQSDDEDAEIELGQCEQSGDPVNLKRMRRKISNMNSARRSRQRKQAQMTELECQVVNLQKENASLFKDFTNASQEYSAANTNNRVLKSGVEALRAKVKLAEDMVARGTLSHSLNQILQNHISKTTEPWNAVRTMSNLSPTINPDGDAVSYTGAMTSGHRLGGWEMSNMIDNLKSSIESDDLFDFWA